MEKKGASEIIGWVLLVGLSVMLAIIVTTWAKQQAQDTSEFIIKDVQDDLRCEEVSMKAFIETPPCSNINVSNTGYHKIIKIIARHKFGTQEFEVNLLPQKDSKVLNINIPSKIDIIPVIQSGNELIGCADRKLVLEC